MPSIEEPTVPCRANSPSPGPPVALAIGALSTIINLAAAGTSPAPASSTQLVVPAISFGAIAGSTAETGGSSDRDAGAFGRKGTRYFSIGAGAAFSSATDAVAQFGYHQFLADRFELALILGGWYHAQPGDDAGSASISAHFRYHFINRERWSAYALAGAGIMGSSDNVPRGGTGLNFLPTLGIGSTIQLGNSEARLDLGVRWHHISNANINGSGRNPDRDAPMVYLGVMFPF